MNTSNISRSGVALVIVLGMLVLLSGLLVAFMSTASIERNAAVANSGAVASRQIADNTISMVVGHIREATNPVGGDGKPDEKATWASQPGAIRVFTGRANLNKKTPLRDGAFYTNFDPGSSDKVYKLYSTDELVSSVSRDQVAPFQDDISVIENWDRSNPDSDYVDLNQPLMTPRFDLDESGSIVEPIYPIVDPRALYEINGRRNLGPGPGMVEGFDAKIDFDDFLKAAPPGSGGGQAGELPYLPMPVKWLYVLRDGSMYSEKQLSDDESLLKDNPIVGRTAFWVDDETCKININTASEGTFWDTPTVSNLQDAGTVNGLDLAPSSTGLGLAASQPARFEYQRYPGHPATTCLSPVLGGLWNLNANTSLYPFPKVDSDYKKAKDAIYQFAPFIPNGPGTSNAANVAMDPDRFSNSVKSGERNVRVKHLYASVDDLIFQSDRFRGDEASVNNPLTPDVLSRAEFFLTAHSRAPETNVFGRPRVTIWPIHVSPEYRTQFDDLFIFASTVYKQGNSSKHYSIFREDAKSATNDYSGRLGGEFYGELRRQNGKMYDYLLWLTGSDKNGSGLDVPGFGRRFSDPDKYGGNPDEHCQILTQIFDYVRAVNLVDTGTATRQGNVFVPYTPPYFTKKFNNEYSREWRSIDWSGQVTPLRVLDSRANSGGAPQNALVSGFQGQGRFFTVQEVAILFYRGGTAPNEYLQAVLLLEMATTTPGFVGLRPTYYTRVNPVVPTQIRIGNGNFQTINLCGTPNAAVSSGGFGRGLINIPNVSPHEVTFGRAFMPVLGFTSALHYFPEHKGATNLLGQTPESEFANPATDSQRVGGASRPSDPNRKQLDNSSLDSRIYKRNSTIKFYPYVSDRIPANSINANAKMDLKGGTFEIQIWAGESPEDPRASGDTGNLAGAKYDATGKPNGLVQVVKVRFPDSTPANGSSIPVPVKSGKGDFIGRFKGTLDEDWSCIDGKADVVRSMELVGVGSKGPDMTTNTAVPPSSRGDLRLMAARNYIGEDFFEPRDGIKDFYGGTRCVHGLQCSHGEGVDGHTGGGKLASNISPRPDKPAMLPKGTNGVTRIDGGPGDWDRGLSKHMSGAFINKVDEGNLQWSPSQTSYSKVPYFRGRGIEETGQTMFTPNRQLSSAVMFGSIPTGVLSGRPWQTLLFRPDREIGPGHPGAKVLPDHLWLDLFNMPVVEPYAISEPISTAGKVNLNYVIAPFGYAKGVSGSANGTTSSRSYLRRDTALRGVMKSTFVMAVPKGAPDGGHSENPGANSQSYRFPINLDRTIEQMETRLKAPDGSLFRTASEICTVDLYPKLPGNSTVTNWDKYWTTDNTLTGDNMRERPYSYIYPRVTTKSNTYTVHMWCQAIKKSPKSKKIKFDPEDDQIVGEYRGSATIERYIDPNDPALLNYEEKNERLDKYYRYRVVNTKHFAPR